MNLLHLKYVIEVAKAGSISKAASNLYMNQPHLSKIIKEFEENMHIIIFERTSKGVIPTKKGAEFIERARNILAQVAEMEALYCNYDEKTIHLDISVPRASYIANAFTNYLSKLNFSDKKIRVNYRETNSIDTIKQVYEGDVNLGIIRFFDDEKNYFINHLQSKELEYQELYQFKYQLLVSKENPLVYQKEVLLKDLNNQIEITHGDVSLPSRKMGTTTRSQELLERKEISIYDRGIQFELLASLIHSYMWVSPMPKQVLDRYNLTTLICKDYKVKSYDWLITRKGYHLSKEDQNLVAEIKGIIANNWGIYQKA